MEQIIIYLALILIGLCMGSFAGASVWRLRARQLKQDKSDGENIDKVEYNKLKKLTSTKLSQDRSVCLSCNYKLEWFDLIPLFSWLFLAGKCRKCKKPIGYMELFIEIIMATFFVLSFMFWPYTLINSFEITRFVLWLITGVVLAILFIYDTKWMLLPDSVNFSIIGIGLLNVILVIAGSDDKTGVIINVIGSLVILSGIYWLLYVISKGKWIGFGDIKLGVGLALMLVNWQLAFIALFAANLIGCLIVIPGLLTGKLKRNSHVPFGPLMIIGFLIAGIVGNSILDLFMGYLFY